MNKLYLVGLLSACYILNAVYADDCGDTPTNLMGLCQEFQLLEDLAPRDSVNSLIRNHMSNDIRFNKAVQYMLSPQFKKTTAQIDATVTFQSFLKQFTRAGVNVSDINSVGKIFDCLILPDIEEISSSSRSSFFNENIPQSRSLDTFAQEFIKLIPAKEFVNTLKAQIADNSNFNKFYKVARTPSFRSKVMQSLNNRDISRPIKQLRRNQIDLCKLVEYAFDLLYTGPAV
ncbi:uncharacterized protein ACRADG_010729 [Cochliomyia hominivorax]